MATEYNLPGVPTTKAIHSSRGLLFIGYIICLGLWGVALAQSAFYFYHFPRDGRFRKITVLAINIIDIVHISLISSMFWDMFVYNRVYGINVSTFIGHPWQMLVFLPTLSILEITTQGFFAHRVWRVSRGNVVIVIVIVFFSVMAATALLLCLFHGPFPLVSTPTIVRMSMTPILIVDGTTYGSLIFYFNGSRLGMPRTEPVLRQLIWLSLNSGLLLWLFTAMCFYMYERNTADPANILAPAFIISQLYVNSLLAALNSRRHLRALINRTITFNMPISEVSQLAIE